MSAGRYFIEKVKGMTIEDINSMNYNLRELDNFALNFYMNKCADIYISLLKKYGSSRKLIVRKWRDKFELANAEFMIRNSIKLGLLDDFNGDNSEVKK